MAVLLVRVGNRLENVYIDNMTANGNSVNIKRTYHHGDLSAAVIAAALARLEDGEEDSLSLREVARDVGVSATAIYRHFPDKEALLDALAAEAIDRLAARQIAASEAAGGGAAGFNACGRAYVRFALENPALFRLLCARLPTSDPLGADVMTVGRALRFLRESVDGLLPASATAEQRRVMALHAWALVHGLAVLMIDGQVPRDLALVDAVVDGTGLALPACPPGV